MSLWNTLPRNIHSLIFEFDPTYRRETYEALIKEFLYRTPFWRVRYLHSNCVNDGKFENKRDTVLHISDYWNNIMERNRHLKFTQLSEHGDENIEEEINTDVEFLTDNCPNKYHIIFRDLKLLKNYNWIFTDCEVRLIRRKVTTAGKILTSRKRSKNNHRNRPYSNTAIKNSSSNIS
jgi:hypothetical protein